MSFPQIDVPAEIRGQFFSLLRAGKLCEAISLLSAEKRAKFPQCLPKPTNSTMMSNSTNVSMPTNITVISYTNTSIISGLEQIREHKRLVNIYAWIIIVTSIVGIIGNSAVIATHLRRFQKYTNQKKTGMDVARNSGIARLLFLHLAFCDLIFAILQTVLISPSLRNAPWPYGLPMCKIILGAVLLGSLVAVGTILIIASERHSGSFKMVLISDSRARVMIKLLIVWVAAIVTIIPYMIALQVGEVSEVCAADWTASGITSDGGKAYDIFLLVAWFIIPFGFIMYFYGTMVNLLRTPLDKRGLGPMQTNNEYMIKRRKGDIRAVKILLAVIIMFLLCCLPIRIVRVILDFVNTLTLTQSQFFALLYTGLLPYPFHVCCNPIIYSLVDRKFQRDLKELFCCAPVDPKAASEPSTSSTILGSVVGGLKRKMFSNQYSMTTSVGSTPNRSPRPSFPRRASEIPDEAGMSNGVFTLEVAAIKQ